MLLDEDFVLCFCLDVPNIIQEHKNLQRDYTN